MNVGDNVVGTATVVDGLPVAVVVSPPQTVNVVTVSGPVGPMGPAGTGIIVNLTGAFPLYYDQGLGVIGIYSGTYATPSTLSQMSGVLATQTTLVSGYANYLYGNNVVYRTGVQLISGVKTFVTGLHVSGNGINFDTPVNPPWQEGRTFYDQTEHALSYYNDASDVTVNLGQEMLVRATNKSSVNILDGQAVYISGAQGNRPKIWLAVASGVSSENIIGVVTHNIPDNQNGYVTTQGVVRGLNMSAFTEGDPVYLSPTIPGGFTSVMPQSPNIIVKIGTVLNNSATQGSLYVDPEIISSHLAYLHDVRLNTGTLQQGNLLAYNATGHYWTNTPALWSSGANGIYHTGSNVGIGTTAPTAQLHTTSTVRFANFGAGSATFDANGNVSSSSDERLKNIEGPFLRGLESLVGIHPIVHTWRPEAGLDTVNRYVGFSAQQVLPHIPEAVFSGANGYYSFSDRPVMAALVNSVKQLVSILDAQNARIAHLESLIDPPV